MAAEVVHEFCETLLLLKSSPLLREVDKRQFLDIVDGLPVLKQNSYFVELVTNFMSECKSSVVSRSNCGGILSLVNDREITKRWRNLWKLMVPASNGLDCDEYLRYFRSYLLVTASITPPDGSRLQLDFPLVPSLDSMPAWNACIDDALYQRYDTQYGFILAKLKQILKVSKSSMKANATAIVENVANNVSTNNGLYRFHVDRKLYKIPLAVDLKAKSHFNCSYGDEAARMLKLQLLGDDDLKYEVVKVLRDCSSLVVSEAAYCFLYELITNVTIRSVLKFCISSAGLVPSQQMSSSLPLRSKLCVLGTKTKK